MTSDVLLARRAARRERQYMYMPRATRYVLATPSAWVRHAVMTRTPASFLLHCGIWTARGLSGPATNSCTGFREVGKELSASVPPLECVCQKSAILLSVGFPLRLLQREKGTVRCAGRMKRRPGLVKESRKNTLDRSTIHGHGQPVDGCVPCEVEAAIATH